MVSADTEKATLFHNFKKNTTKLTKFGMEGNFFNLIKATNENLRVNVTLSCKSFRTFLLRPRTRHGCPISPGVFNSVVEVLIRQLGLG